VIEQIFGVCKRHFQLMTIAPEYSIQTQARIPIALVGLHNFICINDPDDYASNEHGTGGPHNPTFTLHEADGDECHEFLEEELGRFISAAEKSRATAFRDAIAEAMWAQYIVDGENDSDSV
jgi:hypothetical protein